MLLLILFVQNLFKYLASVYKRKILCKSVSCTYLGFTNLLYFQPYIALTFMSISYVHTFPAYSSQLEFEHLKAPSI